MNQPASSKVILTDGYCDNRFSAVKQAFRDNLEFREEIGTSVAVFHKGELVVNLWGGFKDEAKTTIWNENTLSCFMSTTKGIASIAVLSLVDRYKINLDDPVAKYWPKFSTAGKESITIRHVLSQTAGLPVLDNAPDGSYYDQQIMTESIETQKPLWKPGTTPCYHSFTHGPLCSKIVFEVTGKIMGEYLRDELLGPANLEFPLGLTDEQIEQCTEISLSPGTPSIDKANTQGTLLQRAWRPVPDVDNLFNSETFKRSEFASGNGHATAKMVAEIFSRLANIDRVPKELQILSKTVLNDAIQEQWDAVEKMTDRHFRYGSGFMLNNTYFTTGPSQRSFGHPGLGGPIGFADPDNDIAFAYVCNKIHPIDNTGDRASALIDAVYTSILSS